MLSVLYINKRFLYLPDMMILTIVKLNSGVAGLVKSPARRPGATRNFSRATAVSLLTSRRATTFYRKNSRSPRRPRCLMVGP